MLSIEKPKDRDLIVLNLSDFNMSTDELEEGTDSRRIMDATVLELIERVKPDYITFTGDFAYGKRMENYRIMADLIETAGVPWSFVWGNHDNEFFNNDKILEVFDAYPRCLYEKGDAELGSCNYTVAVTEDGKPIYTFIFMDSHNREFETDENGEEKKYWGRLNKAQLEWYEATAKKVGRNALVTHIPMYFYKDAFDDAWNAEYDPKTVSYADSHDGKYWKVDGAYGVNHEGIHSYPRDGGEIAYFDRAGTTELILVGHDHKNCFAIPYHGMTLAYALKTGSGCYWEPELNGGTVLTVGKDGAKLENVFVDPTKYMG